MRHKDSDDHQRFATKSTVVMVCYLTLTVFVTSLLLPESTDRVEIWQYDGMTSHMWKYVLDLFNITTDII